MRSVSVWLLVVLLSWLATPAAAHTGSVAYLDVQPRGERIAVQWSVSLIDLNEELALDLDADAAITWGELRTRVDGLGDLLARDLEFRHGQRLCTADAPVNVRVDSRQGEALAVLATELDCGTPVATVRLRYRFLAGRNELHRVLLTTHTAGDGRQTRALAPGDHEQELVLAGAASRMRVFAGFVHHGFAHILEGWDHILFVVVLVVSAAFPRGEVGTSSARARGLRLVKLVSLFTLAHSLTLALSALQIFSLPSRLVEIGIAASIVVAAVHNLRPLFRARIEGALVFAFGLLHGMGFAGLLNDLLLSTSHRVTALAGFNVGVELGQLAIVLLAAPVLLLPWLPARVQHRLATAVSVATIGAGGFWVVARAL